MHSYQNFTMARTALAAEMSRFSYLVPPTNWQSMDVSNKPEMATHELFNISFEVPLPHVIDMTKLQADIQPNLPWADDHFRERICGEPINPGEQWAKWPFGHSADKFRDANGQFNHNYMERYWPRYAGMTRDGKLPVIMDELTENVEVEVRRVAHRGIRHEYGDLRDVIEQLLRDPLTRQAYIPIFFPEDTGNVHGGRIPCSLGYHIIRRNDQLHISYFMRSCDLRRHLNDDMYLTVRLLLWILDELKSQDGLNWWHVRPGTFSMFISSLHIFRNDWYEMFPDFQTPTGGINEYFTGTAARPRGDAQG